MFDIVGVSNVIWVVVFEGVGELGSVVCDVDLYVLGFDFDVSFEV